jgi:REP element-mobilizing transposase RayT
MDRGDRSEAIFRDDGDRELFLRTLGQTCERTGWRVHAYVLMNNHYHILLETLEPNLSAGMHWLQSAYTIRHNVKHGLKGHLFQGRYKAIPVDGRDGLYFRTVSDYIHLNPARAGLVGERLLDFRWSSFPALVGAPRKRPRWLCAEWVLEQGDRASARMALRENLELRAREDGKRGGIDKEMLKALRRGWYFGSEDFRADLLDRLAGGNAKAVGMARMHDEREAERLVKEGLAILDLSEIDLSKTPKGSAAKIALAKFIRSRTMISNSWLSLNLHMGDPSRVCRYCSASRPDVEKLVVKLEMSIGKA